MSDLDTDLASLRIERETDDPNRPRRGRALIGLGIAVAIAVGVAVYGYPAAQSHLFKTEVSLTEISVVSPAQSSITVTSTGYVVAQRNSKVAAKISGRLHAVRVKEGDKVKTGALLAELDANDQRSTIAAAGSRAAAAEARVQTARANLAEVRRQVERNRALVARGAIAPATLEDLESRLASLEEQVKAAEAEAVAAHAEIVPMRVGLEDRIILAPIDGTIVTKPLEIGEHVGPEVTLLEIADFGSMLVETDVPEARLYQVKVGTPCEIVLDAYPGKRYRGEAVEIAQRIDRAKATVKVKVKFVDPMDGVLPEMSARTSFLSKALSDEAIRQAPKTVVPGTAIVIDGGQRFVYVVEEDVVHRKSVKLGAPFGSGFELVEGPPAGTRLVANPPAGLVDGRKVKEKGT